MEIQYLGNSGITEDCKKAIISVVQGGTTSIKSALVLSVPSAHGASHAILLSSNRNDHFAIRSGFSSGYIGEGPKGFSYVLGLLKHHNIETEEAIISHGTLKRLNNSALTDKEISAILATPPVRPYRLFEFMLDSDYMGVSVWKRFPPVMPFSIIDSRIQDLALRFFERPDESLVDGYRRLEDIVRNRTSLPEYGDKLLSQAFLNADSKLTWNISSPGEQTGKAQLFIGAFKGYRNPRAHRELNHSIEDQLREFLLLNHLFVLEAKSFSRTTSP